MLPSRAKLEGLQVGRAVAAVVVVVAHAIAHPFSTTPGLTHLLARFGVTLFFVISGFIMVYTTGTGRFDPREFMRRRIVRIVPLYYFATLTTLLLFLAAPQLFKTTLFELKHFIMSLLFIPSFRPGGV